MPPNSLNDTEKAILLVSRSAAIVAACFVVIAGIFISIFFGSGSEQSAPNGGEPVASETTVSSVKEIKKSTVWRAPDEITIPAGENSEQIRYGKELIAHTAAYFGPNGKVAATANGMNCQNCHLEGGTKPWGNNYSAVYSTYPKFRARSGTKETIVKRINDCFERSLNGKALDSTGTEMKAMIAYMKWLGSGVEKGKSPEGVGLEKLAYLNRPADPKKGAVIFSSKCRSCHGDTGQGLLNTEKTEYIYPPLWGKNSYNDGAGLYRLSGFAGYVKNNMPLGATKESPQLSDEESWDLAAFVNSQTRPHKDQRNDWKELDTKPFDFPLGPYADQFSEAQHKFGPFEPIVQNRKLLNKK